MAWLIFWCLCKAVWAVYIFGSSGLDDIYFRNRHDELPTSFPVFSLLFEDLVGKIPGKQKHIVRHVFQQLLRRQNLQMHTGHDLAVLVRVPIYDILDHRRIEARIVQQYGSLGRGAVRHYSLSVRPDAPDQTAQTLTNPAHPICKILVVGETAQPKPTFLILYLLQLQRGRLVFLNIQTDRTTMDRQSF